MIFEKHYYRAGNFLTLTLMVSADGENVIVDSLASGARDGIFDITWGAEEDFASESFALLKPMGFEIFEKSEEAESFDFFGEAPSEEPLESILQRGKNAAKAEKTDNAEPERVELGREEKKGLFGKKRNKPDWEY